MNFDGRKILMDFGGSLRIQYRIYCIDARFG